MGTSKHFLIEGDTLRLQNIASQLKPDHIGKITFYFFFEIYNLILETTKQLVNDQTSNRLNTTEGLHPGGILEDLE